MRSYEAMIAYHPETGEAVLKDLLERVKQIVAGAGGEVSQVIEWGVRDLAYRIEKQRRAIYFVVEFKGSGATVAELERNLRISDRVLRYITVQVDPNRPPLEAPRSRREAALAGDPDAAPEAPNLSPRGEGEPDEPSDLESPEIS